MWVNSENRIYFNWSGLLTDFGKLPDLETLIHRAFDGSRGRRSEI